MATVKNTSKKRTTKTKKTTREAIVSAYMDDVLMTEAYPKSVYKFCKEHNFDEQEFYEHFGSFKNLESSIWSDFYGLTITLLHKSEEYQQYSNREKLLTFYYTFFEMLTANRSYVVHAIDGNKNQLKSMAALTELKKSFSEYIENLNIQTIDFKEERLEKLQLRSLKESAWLQFCLLYTSDAADE